MKWKGVWKKAVALVLLPVLVMVSCRPVYEEPLNAADPYDSMRAKWKTMLTGGTAYDPKDPDIAAKLQFLDNEISNAEKKGFWDLLQKDKDRENCGCLWKDQATKQSHELTTSYDRLREMALALETKGSRLENNAELRADILSALDWMYDNRFSPRKESSNWWDWDIGAPVRLNDIMVLMYDHLSPEQIKEWHSSIDTYSPDQSGTSYEYWGANRVWRSSVHAVRGVVGKSPDKLELARDGLSDLSDGHKGDFNVFRYRTSSDGFYEDGSFVQHSQFSYTGGYGVSMLKDLSNVLYLLQGSSWEVKDPLTENVWKWIYDAYDPLLTATGQMMDMSRGREISRYYSSDSIAGHEVMSGMLRLAQIAPPEHAAAFKQMVKSRIAADPGFYKDASIEMIYLAKAVMNDASIQPRGELVMNKMYAAMARAVHHRPGFAFGLSMFSNRIANFEGNPENLRGWYTGSGMTYLYTGDPEQYADGFWTTVDSYRLPGTTVDTKERKHGEAQGYRSKKDWTGGVSDGEFGAAGMELDSPGDTLTARKSWFMFDNEIVALGSGIKSSDGRRIETIVDNRKLNEAGSNALTINGKLASSAPGWKDTLKDVSWMHLEGNQPGTDVGYVFPGGKAAVNGLRETRKGNWASINWRQIPAGNPAQSSSYMTLWLDHGANPSDKSYQYVLLPNQSSAEVGSYAASPEIEIVENSTAAHVVRESTLGVTGANFWNDGVKKAGGITSDRKASVLLRELPDGLSISVADPTRANEDGINIEIDRAALSLVSADPLVTVTQLSPTIKLNIRTKGTLGRSQQVKLAAASTETGSAFRDLTGYTWAKSSIEALAGKGVVEGTAAGVFAPAAQVSRADFMVLLVRALGLKAQGEGSFADVPSSAYYYDAVRTALKLGITKGAAENRFDPLAPVSRQDMMVMIDRALKASGKPISAGSAQDLQKFTDRGQLASYAVDSAAALVKNKIVEGEGDRIRPLSTTSRAEIAVLIHRIVK